MEGLVFLLRRCRSSADGTNVVFPRHFDDRCPRSRLWAPVNFETSHKVFPQKKEGLFWLFFCFLALREIEVIEPSGFNSTRTNLLSILKFFWPGFCISVHTAEMIQVYYQDFIEWLHFLKKPTRATGVIDEPHQKVRFLLTNITLSSAKYLWMMLWSLATIISAALFFCFFPSHRPTGRASGKRQQNNTLERSCKPRASSII